MLCTQSFSCASLADAVRENDRCLFHGWQADDHLVTGHFVTERRFGFVLSEGVCTI